MRRSAVAGPRAQIADPRPRRFAPRRFGLPRDTRPQRAGRSSLIAARFLGRPTNPTDRRTAARKPAIAFARSAMAEILGCRCYRRGLRDQVRGRLGPNPDELGKALAERLPRFEPI